MSAGVVVAVAVVCALVSGFGAGWGLKPQGDKAMLEAQAKVLEEQKQTLTALQEGQKGVLEAAQRPVVLDAELKSTLAQVPVQCRKEVGGDPRSAECAWATCLQFGQSSAQRPECRAVEALMIKRLEQNGCPDEG